MRRWAVTLCGLAVVVAMAIWLWPQQQSRLQRPSTRSETASKVETPDSMLAAARVPGDRPGAGKYVPTAKQVQLRQEILRRAAQRVAVSPPSEQAAAEATQEPPQPSAAEAGEPSQLKDRIGGHQELIAALAQDFMPLADECIEQARQRSPQLEGMLAIGLEMVADEELGSVVEFVDFPKLNELVDPDLLECIRETALSSVLPPPPSGGREQVMLTLPIEPEG